MQTDTRFIQNINYADQTGANLRCQTDTLRFPTGKRARRSGKRQIFQTDINQKADSGVDFLQNTFRNHIFPFRQRQALEEFLHFANGKLRHLGNILPVDSNGKHLRTQAFPMAIGTLDIRHIFLKFRAHGFGGFVISALQRIDDPFKGIIIGACATHIAVGNAQLFLRAIENNILDFSGQILKGRFQRKAVFRRQCIKKNLTHTPLRIDGIIAGGGNCALHDAELLIRHNQLFIKLHLHPQTRTGRAGPAWIIDGEHARFNFHQIHAAVGAGKALAEQQLILSLIYIHNQETAAECRCRFDGFGQTHLHAFLYHQTVYHDFNAMLFIFFQFDFFGKVIQNSIHAHTHIAALFCILQQLDMLALSAAHHGCQQLQLRPLRQLHNAVYNLVDGLFFDFLAAFRAMGNPDSCVEQTQIIINLRYRTDGGTGVMARCFLVDGDGRRKPLDEVYIRLFHLPQKLPCIGGERLHIASLSLCIYRIESKRAFAAAAHPRKDNQLISGDGEVNIFQIMRSRTLYYNLILHSVSFSWDIPFQRIAQVLTIIS